MVQDMPLFDFSLRWTRHPWSLVTLLAWQQRLPCHPAHAKWPLHPLLDSTYPGEDHHRSTMKRHLSNEIRQSAIRPSPHKANTRRPPNQRTCGSVVFLQMELVHEFTQTETSAGHRRCTSTSARCEGKAAALIS